MSDLGESLKFPSQHTQGAQIQVVENKGWPGNPTRNEKSQSFFPNSLKTKEGCIFYPQHNLTFLKKR